MTVSECLHDQLRKWEISPFVAPLVQGLASILDNTPVYTLDETKSKEALFKKFGQKITVEKGAIRLETSIFWTNKRLDPSRFLQIAIMKRTPLGRP